MFKVHTISWCKIASKDNSTVLLLWLVNLEGLVTSETDHFRSLLPPRFYFKPFVWKMSDSEFKQLKLKAEKKRHVRKKRDSFSDEEEINQEEFDKTRELQKLRKRPAGTNIVTLALGKKINKVHFCFIPRSLSLILFAPFRSRKWSSTTRSN